MRVNRLKTTYQRNMALSMLIIISIALGFSLGVYDYSDNDIVVFNTDTLDIIIIDNSSIAHDNLPAKRSGKNAPLISKDDYLRFLKAYEFHDNAIQAVEITSDPAIVPTDNQMYNSDDISFSICEGDTIGGIHIPDGYDYIFRLQRKPQNYDLEITIIYKVDPEYPAIALERKIEGSVTILIYIDKEGNLQRFRQESPSRSATYKMFYIISEEPKDWFFAENLIEVLSHWIFAPKIENGMAVNSFLKVRYSYCLGITCSNNDSQDVSISKDYR